MIGFTSAQTSNESKQDEFTDGNTFVMGRGKITDFPMQAWNRLYVTHMWKHNEGGALGGLLKSHHSKLVVSRENFRGNTLPVFYIDLVHFKTNKEKAMIRVYKAADHTIAGYTQSTSYSPNPIIKSGNEIVTAFNYTVGMMASRYDVLTNNCQKFGRIFMTQLGAKHQRQLFHL